MELPELTPLVEKESEGLSNNPPLHNTREELEQVKRELEEWKRLA